MQKENVKFFEPILNDLISKYKIPSVTRMNIDGKRFYEIQPGLDGERLRQYMSATTFLKELSGDDDSWLQNWYDRIGEIEAKNITNRAGSFGTAMHDNIESRVKNNDKKSITYDVLCKELNESNMEDVEIISQNCDIAVQDMLDVIKKRFVRIMAMENYVFSDTLKISGAFDALGTDIDGNCTIIDFKNSRSAKMEKYIENYFFQVFIYAMAIREMLFKYVKPKVDESEWADIKRLMCPTHFSIICYNRAEAGEFSEPHVQVFSGSLSDLKERFFNAYNSWKAKNTPQPF